jgi:hypothetical protein
MLLLALASIRNILNFGNRSRRRPSCRLSPVSSNVKLDNVEVLKSSDGYELWSQKMSVIFEAMGLYEIVVTGIDPSPLASAEELITFQLAQRQGLLVIIQVVSNEIFGEIAKLKTPHDMWIYLRTSYRREFNPFVCLCALIIYAHRTTNQSGKGIAVGIYIGL